MPSIQRLAVTVTWTLCFLAGAFSDCKPGYFYNPIGDQCNNCTLCTPPLQCEGCINSSTPNTTASTPRDTSTSVPETNVTSSDAPTMPTDTPSTASPGPPEHVLPKWAIGLLGLTAAAIITMIITVICTMMIFRRRNKSGRQPRDIAQYHPPKKDDEDGRVVV